MKKEQLDIIDKIAGIEEVIKEILEEKEEIKKDPIFWSIVDKYLTYIETMVKRFF